MKLVARGVTVEWPHRPLIMGIVNLGADSFSGDGIVEIDRALEHARRLVRAGAEIIDLGAESARTNRAAISAEEEAGRLVEFVERWDAEVRSSKPEVRNKQKREKGEGEERADRSVSALSSDCFELRASSFELLLSVNTWRPAVARAVLAVGGHLLNDIGGLPTEENARLCAETGAALLIMHTVGEPKMPHFHVAYDDVMASLEAFFAAKIALAEAAGLPRDAIVLDPGIDFAKQCEDNLRIFGKLEQLAKFERPILLPVSRKTVIGEVLGIENPAARDAGTVACIVQGMLRGASIFRVHNVHAAAQVVRMIEAVETAPAHTAPSS